MIVSNFPEIFDSILDRIQNYSFYLSNNAIGSIRNSPLMRTPEKHTNNRNVGVNIRNRNSLAETSKIIDDEDLTSREESTVALDGAPVSGTTRNNDNLWPDLFDDVCEIKPWNESKVARRSFISVLSALYALVVVILSLAFEVSGLVADNVNGERYHFFYIYLYGVGLLFFAYCYTFLMQTNDWWSQVREFLCGWHCCCRRKLRKQQSFPSPADDLQQNHLTVDQTTALVGRRNTLPMTCDSSRPSQIFNASDLALTVNKYSPDNSKYPFLSAKRKVTHSAKNAGSFYLRLGAMIFGIVAMIDRSLQLFQAVDTGRVPYCYSISNVCEDVIAMMFIFVQLYFIFQNSKMTIHRFKEAGRFGTMHLIATNLCMWIRAVVVEEYHIIQEIRETLHHSDDESSNASHVNAKSRVNSAVSASHAALSIIGGSSVYEDYSHCEYGDKELDHIIHYTKAFTTTCIIEYALICAGVSFIMWRNIGHTVRLRSKFRKQNFQIDCSSSTKGLFVGLLFVVFTLVTMVIFFTKIRLKQNIDALFIFYISDGLLYVASIVALVFAAWKMRYLHYVSGNDRVVLLDDILLIVALIGQLMFCLFSMLALSSFTYVAILMVVVSLLRMIEVLIQTMFIFVAQRLVALTPSAQARKPGRELITFLLLINLAMFLINTFEAQKAGSNPMTMQFYGHSVWTVIVHSTAPLSSFYRFHSSVCFAEIWKSVYRLKESIT